jgi:hypothetical protein
MLRKNGMELLKLIHWFNQTGTFKCERILAFYEFADASKEPRFTSMNPAPPYSNPLIRFINSPHPLFTSIALRQY